MKLRIRSITAKVAIAYLILAVISLALVCTAVYENQTDLIAQNARYRVSAALAETITSLDALPAAKEGDSASRGERIDAIIGCAAKSSPSSVLFTEKGEILKSAGGRAVSPDDILSGMRSITGRDFSGKRYYSSVNESSYEMSFYVPVDITPGSDAVLLMSFSIKEIPAQLSALYRQILILIAALALLHLIVGIAVYMLVIAPTKRLHAASSRIAAGDLSARALIRQDDEIGDLGRTFNAMAGSIQEKVDALLLEKRINEEEMEVAGDVQHVIFPELADGGRFSYGLFHRPFSRVSGDYFDVLPLDGGRTGFLIADVSGHGVPAALLTMLVKQVFRQYAHSYADPAELFRKVNTETTEILRSKPKTIYFTAFYAILSPDNTLVWCKAGHLDQYIVRSGGAVETITSNGVIVGVETDMNHLYENESTVMREGDTLVLLTDGILEAANVEDVAYGEPRFARSLAAHANPNPAILTERLVSDLSSFIGGTDKLKDDATIFAVRTG